MVINYYNLYIITFIVTEVDLKNRDIIFDKKSATKVCHQKSHPTSYEWH